MGNKLFDKRTRKHIPTCELSDEDQQTFSTLTGNVRAYLLRIRTAFWSKEFQQYREGVDTQKHQTDPMVDTVKQTYFQLSRILQDIGDQRYAHHLEVLQLLDKIIQQKGDVPEDEVDRLKNRLAGLAQSFDPYEGRESMILLFDLVLVVGLVLSCIYMPPMLFLVLLLAIPASGFTAMVFADPKEQTYDSVNQCLSGIHKTFLEQGKNMTNYLAQYEKEGQPGPQL